MVGDIPTPATVAGTGNSGSGGGAGPPASPRCWNGSAALDEELMLYSVLPPSRHRQRVRLYLCPQAARAASQGGDLYRVAVHFDGLLRRLVPLRPLPEQLDPAWTVLAEHDGEDCIVTYGPIPPLLFSGNGSVLENAEEPSEPIGGSR